MLREWGFMVLVLTALVACGQAEFATTTDDAVPAGASSQDDSVAGSEEGDDASTQGDDDFEVGLDDDGGERECQDDLKLPKNCMLTLDRRIICKDVTRISW